MLDQPTFRRDDTIAINDGIEIPCGIFDRLRPGRWLDSWTIHALMQISDKPGFVKYDLSIPLHKSDDLQPIKHPLRAWAAKMGKCQEKARKPSGDRVPLVFFCPINHKGHHFSLLEVNEREKVIRHYDSMVKVNNRLRMEEVVEEQFGDLNFPYVEVVSISAQLWVPFKALTGIAYSTTGRRLELRNQDGLELPTFSE